MKLLTFLVFVISSNLAMALPPPPPEGKVVGKAKATVVVKLIEVLDFREATGVLPLCEAAGEVSVYEKDSGAAYGNDLKLNCPSPVVINGKSYELSIRSAGVVGKNSKMAHVHITLMRPDAKPVCDFCGPAPSAYSHGSATAVGSNITALEFDAPRSSALRVDQDKFWLDADVKVEFQ